jgi:hypothetical protein
MPFSTTNVDDIIKWEDGQMDSDEEAEFFQKLVNSGLAWQLQGMYGRRARQLIDDGIVTLPTNRSTIDKHHGV